MAVTQVHEALGSFEFELLGGVPREILDAIEYFGHIAIVPGRMNPLEYGDGTLGAARYVGVVRRKKLADDGRTNLIMDDIRIGGVGMNFWLGDDEEKGAVYEDAVTISNASFNTAVTALAPDSVTIGTIYPVTGTYTGEHQYETPRSAIKYVCDTMSNSGLTVYDTFNRGNSTTTLGDLDSGETWTANSGTWGIESNQGYISAAGQSVATVDVGANVTAQLTVQESGAATSSYLVFRFSDTSNYLRFGSSDSTGTIVLDTVEAGVVTGLGSCVTPMADVTTLKVVASGDAIACYVNGVLELYAETDFNNTATRCGMETDDTDVRFETFSVSPENDPVSFRVNGDGSLDAGPESNLFVTNPTCVVVRKGTSFGEDLFIRALPTTLDMDQDMEDFSTRTLMLAEASGASFATGTADIANIAPDSNVFKDLHGNPMRLTKMISESDTLEQNASVRAELALRQTLEPRRTITLSTEDYDVYGSFTVGDYIYIYDPDAGLVDLSKEITIRGARLNPIKLQVMESDWPITDEYTMAYRGHDGTWYDLTDYCHFDELQPSRIVVGDQGRVLVGDEQSIATRLGTQTTPADTSTPQAPSWITTSFQTLAYLDNQGFVHAAQKVAWSTPLNEGGSAITDGDRYEIQYRLDSGHMYSQTWGAVAGAGLVWSDGTPTGDEINTWEQPVEPDADEWESLFVGWGTNSITLQNLAVGTAYDVRIRAVDTSNNMSEWSPTETFTTATDDIPPSTPAPPTVAGSLIAIQVTHTLGKSSGGTYNLENDLAYLEVHAEYEPNYVCTDATKLGNLRANQGMMAANTPAVATFQVSQTVPVYVKVVAVDISGNRSSASAPSTVTAELIDDQYISNLSVSKITAGTISTNWLLAGSIKTATEGARVEMDMMGIRSFNSDNVETLDISAENGSIEMLGSASSLNYEEGVTGWRIDSGGSTQFDNINALGNISGGVGNFDEVYMGGTLLPSQDTLESYFKAPIPALKVHRVNSFTLPSDTSFKILPWDYVEYIINANDDMFNGANSTRLVAPVNGMYMLNFAVGFDATTDGHASIVNWRRNSAGSDTGGDKVYEDIQYGSGGYRTSNPGTCVVYLNAGDYLECFVRSVQSESPALTIHTGYDGNTVAQLTYMGRYVTGVLNTSGTGAGGGSEGQGENDALPEPVTKTWWATYTRSFDSDNTLRSSYSHTRCYQGWFSSSHGNQKSVVGFDWQDIQDHISGHDVKDIKLTLRVQHSYYNSGITVAVGTHEYSNAPSTWDESNVLTHPRRLYKEDLRPGGTYTFSLTSFMIDDLVNNGHKGIIFGAAPANQLGYYGYMYGGSSSYRPRLTITYQ